MATDSTISVPRVRPEHVHDVIGGSMLADGMPFVVDLDRSAGSRLHDALSGRDYLDFFNYFATQPLGHNHPAMVDPEFVEHLGRVAITNPSNSDFYTAEMAAFVQTLHDTAQPASLPHLFFVAGGSLAVENGLKAAFDWKFQKRAARGLPDDENLSILHFRHAFHGRSGYTMSLTNTDPHKTKWFPKFDWPRVDAAPITFPLADHLAEVEEAEQRSLAQIREAVDRDGDRIAALIIEPIQGEGGDNHFRPEFLQALRAVCDEHEMLMIVDEVQTGTGTTGRWWAYQHHGIEPDVLCFGKRMQVCGILAGARLDDVDSVFRSSSRINSTWGGNLVDMVRATRYLQVIETEQLVENAATVGAHFLRGLNALQDDFGGLLSNVRGRGLFIAFTLPDATTRGRVLSRCQDQGLLMLPSGPDSIRARPPLTVTTAEADEAVSILRRALAGV